MDYKPKIKPILTVTLNPAVDKIVQMNGCALGKEHRVVSCQVAAGGKGINVSRGLRNFGIPTLAAGFVGGAAGKLITESLAAEGIGQQFVPVRGESRTNLTVIDQKTRAHTRFLEDGPNVTAEELKVFKTLLVRLLKKCEWVVFSGRGIASTGKDFYRQLLQMANQCHCKSVLDTSSEDLRCGLKAKPFLIKPNQEEAEFIFEKKLNSPAKIAEALRFFHRQGARITIISLGAEGAVAFDGQALVKATPPRIRPLNTVGCGDAMVAGFLFAWLKKYDFVTALRFAVAAGTANAFSRVPCGATLVRTQAIFKRVKIQAEPSRAVVREIEE